MLKDNKIKYYVFDHELSPNATMIIESFNRIIRNKIDKYMNAYNTKNYIDSLDDLILNYNTTIHG